MYKKVFSSRRQSYVLCLHPTAFLLHHPFLYCRDIIIYFSGRYIRIRKIQYVDMYTQSNYVDRLYYILYYCVEKYFVLWYYVFLLCSIYSISIMRWLHRVMMFCTFVDSYISKKISTLQIILFSNFLYNIFILPICFFWRFYRRLRSSSIYFIFNYLNK